MADNEPTVAGYRKVRVLRRDALGDVYQATHEKANISVCLRVLASPEDMDADTWGELRYRLVGTLLQLQQVGAIPGIEMVQGVGEVFNAHLGRDRICGWDDPGRQTADIRARLPTARPCPCSKQSPKAWMKSTGAESATAGSTRITSF